MSIEFLKTNEWWKPKCLDGLKSPFLFYLDDMVDEFVECLSHRIESEITKGFFLCTQAIYVPISKYEEALKKGFDILLHNNRYEKSGISWVNCYNELCNWKFEQILEMAVPTNCSPYVDWTPKTQNSIEKWKNQVADVIGKNVILHKSTIGYAQFFIERTDSSDTEHEKLLEKIRASHLIEKSPFMGYAFLSFYGEFIQ